MQYIYRRQNINIKVWRQNILNGLIFRGKYQMEEEKGRPHFYNKLMILYIHNVTQEDFGTYKCLAKNSQGETSGEIDLNGTLEYTNVFKHMRTMFHAILFHHSFKSPLFYWFCDQTFLFIN